LLLALLGVQVRRGKVMQVEMLFSWAEANGVGGTVVEVERVLLAVG
jgi:hypothetical protein